MKSLAASTQGIGSLPVLNLFSVKAAIAELFATAMFVYIGTGTATTFSKGTGTRPINHPTNQPIDESTNQSRFLDKSLLASPRVATRTAPMTPRCLSRTIVLVSSGARASAPRDRSASLISVCTPQK